MSGGRVAAIVVAALSAGVFWSGVAAANEAAKSSAQDPSKRVCKMVIPTGSRMGERICKSADEWQRDSDEARRQYQASHDGLRDSVGAPNPNQH